MGTNVDRTKLYPLVQTNYNIHYAGGVGTVTSLSNYLNSFLTSLNKLGYLFSTPQEYIVSIKVYPFNTTNLCVSPPVNPTNIMLGNEDTGVSAKELGLVYHGVDMGSYTFPSYFNSFLDYAPYTKIKVFLPYVGWMDLNPNECIGKTISFTYAIDLDTGEATAYVSDGTRVINTAVGKIGIDISIGSTNARDIERNLITQGIQSVFGAAQYFGVGGTDFGYRSSMGSLAKATTGLFNGSQIKYQSGSVSSGQNNIISPQSIFIVIERPKIKNVDYSHYKGKPLGVVAKLNTVTGFTKVNKAHIMDDVDGRITFDEIKEIESLLEEGVII